MLVIKMQIFVAQLFRKFTLEHVSFSALVYLGILFTLSSALYKNIPLSVLFYFVFSDVWHLGITARCFAL